MIDGTPSDKMVDRQKIKRKACNSSILLPLLSLGIYRYLELETEGL